MIYVVTRKADGGEVYRYDAPAPVEWNGMEFATHDHTQVVEVAPDGVIVGQSSRILTKLEYLRRFTQAERVAIREAAKVNPILEDYMALLDLAEEVNTGDADTIAALQMLEQAGLIAAGRAGEILNG